ncbi:hypothetical protein CQA63_04890 [Helicobacter marmotae]|uniref:Uncharacterized protein n=1 Tax=Helicobacter marmotae TaxID=152490 RepID=A0A3D8I5T4_9HELI|nr:hypothetical protein CQA63_04890 [Helicobacter marmotae]
MRATEESLSFTKDSLTESLERQLVCHSKPPIKGEELFSKTPKGTTSDSCRDSSVATLPQNDNGIKSTRNPKRDDSQKAHRDSSGLKPLRMTISLTRKRNPHIINTYKAKKFVIFTLCKAKEPLWGF